MTKCMYTVVGISHCTKDNRSYDVLHCEGEYFYPENNEGCNVCNLFVEPYLHNVGDVVEVVYAKGLYICIS